MRKIKLFILGALFTDILFVWVLIEYMQYLVKNDPFNWLSVILCSISFISVIILFIKRWEK